MHCCTGVALLHLVTMAGVCKQWRAIAAEMPAGTAMAFDCFESAFPHQPGVARFRKLTAAQKETIFVGAAKLFHGKVARAELGACKDKRLHWLVSEHACALVKEQQSHLVWAH
jgi:hypothetical protein